GVKARLLLQHLIEDGDGVVEVLALDGGQSFFVLLSQRTGNRSQALFSHGKNSSDYRTKIHLNRATDKGFRRGVWTGNLQKTSVKFVFTIGRSVCPGPAGGTICVFGPASDEAMPKSPFARAAGYFMLRRVADMVELADTLL